SIGPGVSGDRLVNFDINVVGQNNGAPISYNRGSNTCTLTCHQTVHNADGSVSNAMKPHHRIKTKKAPKHCLAQMSYAAPTTEHSSSRQNLFGVASLRVGLMVLLFSCAAVFEAIELKSLSTLSNSDNWGHLRTGIWIIQNHDVPRTGIFSQVPQLA